MTGTLYRNTINTSVIAAIVMANSVDPVSDPSLQFAKMAFEGITWHYCVKLFFLMCPENVIFILWKCLL